MTSGVRTVAALCVAVLLSECATQAVQSTVGQMSARSDATAAVIDQYRREIPQLMEEQGVPGLAVAVVDDQGILWSEGFGVADSHESAPVTPDTTFSLQSTSKTFTATAVLLAVQDGLLDLDEPITTYVPGFTVQSIFEDHPESRITLRHLLSHTAGFTIEAPVGNNWDGDAASFDSHIASISATWLRSPVGSGLRDRLFEPLGMLDSSFDAEVIGAADDRAVGHEPPVPHKFWPVPMVPSGGLYASVNDVARFLEFQLGGGVVDGRALLDPLLVDEMRTVHFPERGGGYGYGLGVGRTGWYRGDNADLFSHGGGGFGFRSDLWWLPELQLGIAVLFNSANHDLRGSLALAILDDLAHEAPYRDRLRSLPDHSRVGEDWDDWLPPPSLASDIRAQAMAPGPARWQSFLGEYQTATLGAWLSPASGGRYTAREHRSQPRPGASTGRRCSCLGVGHHQIVARTGCRAVAGRLIRHGAARTPRRSQPASRSSDFVSCPPVAPLPEGSRCGLRQSVGSAAPAAHDSGRRCQRRRSRTQLQRRGPRPGGPTVGPPIIRAATVTRIAVDERHRPGLVGGCGEAAGPSARPRGLRPPGCRPPDPQSSQRPARSVRRRRGG